MGWLRCKGIFEPQRLGDWAVSHAAVPFVRADGEGGLELFFTARDAEGRSHTARGNLTISEDGPAVTASDEPVLRPGPLGAFDDSGAMGGCLVQDGVREYLYFMGWNLGVTVPFTTLVGCAVSVDGGLSFKRVSPAPVLGRNAADPYLATTPWVLVEEDRWRMWYASGVRWEATPDGPRHYYRIVHAESEDGMEWRPTGHVCIDFASEDEYAIARPCVIRDPDAYRMWFSHRGSAYSIGYAESNDGITWQRDDERDGLRPQGDGWEAQSVEYPYVFDYEGRRWMLYNGNDYGKTGIGLAVHEESQ